MQSPLKNLNLPGLSFSLRVLFTGYLLTAGVGLMVAGVQILLTHGMADGKAGLSVDDIVYSYYGNRTGSRLEIKLNGSMKDKAPVHVRKDIIKWVRHGSTEEGWKAGVQQDFQTYCVKCHGVIPGLPDFRSLAGVKPSANIDKGESIQALTAVSHVHLFGIGFIFFMIGLVFSMAVRISPLVKGLLIFIPFLFLLVDIASWWLTKFYPGFAWVTIVVGTTYMLCTAAMILISLWQMWIMPKTYSAEVAE